MRPIATILPGVVPKGVIKAPCHDSDRLRALVPLPRAPDRDPVEHLGAELAAIGSQLGVSFGISRAHNLLAGDLPILGEAVDAVRVARALDPEGGAMTYDDLGPYRFLVGLIGANPPDHAHARALTTLAEYDLRRRSTLVDTLEGYLDARGVVRATAEALVIHPNTLRQRLERIEAITGLVLADEDLLSLELSLKVHRLGLTAQGAAGSRGSA